MYFSSFSDVRKDVVVFWLGKVIASHFLLDTYFSWVFLDLKLTGMFQENQQACVFCNFNTQYKLTDFIVVVNKSLIYPNIKSQLLNGLFQIYDPQYLSWCSLNAIQLNFLSHISKAYLQRNCSKLYALAYSLSFRMIVLVMVHS